MRVVKAHAYGNDFLYVEQSAAQGADESSLARALCDRHGGMGADGLIVYELRREGASMRLFNADGGRAEVSGNGVRALAALLLKDERTVRASVTIHTDAGPKLIERIDRDGARQTFRAAMGMPTNLRTEAVAVAGESLDVIVMDFGNPHAVVLGALPTRDRFEKLGGELAVHAMFAHGTNVEFVEVAAPDSMRMLIWERGVGPTFSSGTGSCAALVAAASYGGASREAMVLAPGGAQRVEWRSDNVYLTGWAEVVFEAKWLRPQISRT